MTRAGSELDLGWNGWGHDQGFIEGASLTFDVVRRCFGAPDKVCVRHSECASGQCIPFCDCDDGEDSTCEIAGGFSYRRCLRGHERCATNADCTIRPSDTCTAFLTPPLPLSASNTPACAVTELTSDVTGTVDFETGSSTLRFPLRTRILLGETRDKPCPRCGAPAQNPEIGDTFTCESGPHNGDPCTVEAVTPVFGGTSGDCFQTLIRDISTGDLTGEINMTTDVVTRTAEIPCLVSGYCTDDDAPCATNADCLRCTDNLTPCAGNVDCDTSATCAAAPVQPISCGFYCHCGVCEGEVLHDNTSKPCFDAGDCSEGVSCVPGDIRTGRQGQPNGCAGRHACGTVSPEQCCNSEVDGPSCATNADTALIGRCSLAPYIACSADADCEIEGAGGCLLESKPCFGHVITRAGEPSPLGPHCVDDPGVSACTSNGDCATGQCEDESMEPTLGAVFCGLNTSSAAINLASGLPGPGALTWKTLIVVCRCGDGRAGCGEECDDGNTVGADGCDETCRIEN